MKAIIIVITLMISTISVAQNKNAKATMEVDGVCLMCKARIEKAAIKTKGVKSAIWNVESKRLSLIFNEEKTDLDVITKSITEAGHDTKTIKATDEAYAKVHPCCKYRDEKITEEHKEKG